MWLWDYHGVELCVAHVGSNARFVEVGPRYKYICIRSCDLYDCHYCWFLCKCMWTCWGVMITFSFKCSTTWCKTFVMFSIRCGTWNHKPKANMLYFNSMGIFLWWIKHVPILDLCLWLLKKIGDLFSNLYKTNLLVQWKGL
jgi:hypothetical protein